MTKVLTGLLLLGAALCATALGQESRVRARDDDPLAEAQRLASRLMTDRDKEQSLLQLSRAYARAGRFEEARRAAAAMDDAIWKAGELNSLADRLAEAGRFETAATLVAESLGVMERDEESVYSALIELVVGVSRPAHDVTFALERGDGPVGRLIKAGRGDLAAPLLARARDLALKMEDEADRVAGLRGAVARRYAELGEREESASVMAAALRAARDSERPGDRIEALAALATFRAGRGDTDEAAAALKEALEAVAALDEPDRGSGLAQVARAAASVGLHELALTAAAGEEAGDRWRLLAPLCKGRSAPAAVCRRLLDEAVKAARAASDVYGPELLAAVAGVSEETADLLPSLHSAVRTKPAGRFRATELTAVGDRYDAFGQREKAVEAWRESLHAARSGALELVKYQPGDTRIAGDRERVEILRGLARRLVKAGQTEAALECVRALEANHVEARGVAAGSGAEVGDAGGALVEIADALLHSGRRAEALDALAAASRVASDAGENVSDYWRLRALASAAAVYARLGERETAAEHFERALGLTREGREYPASMLTALLIHIGEQYAEAGIKPGPAARKALRRFVRVIEDDLK